MVVAGYLVQVATAPGWRLTWAWVHGVASLLFLAAYLVHALRAWLKPSAVETEPPAQALDWE
jgi:hypothetical protein